MPAPPHGVGFDREPERPGERSGNEKCLVVAAAAKSGGRERHGKNEVRPRAGIRIGRDDRLCEQDPENPGGDESGFPFGLNDPALGGPFVAQRAQHLVDTLVNDVVERVVAPGQVGMTDSAQLAALVCPINRLSAENAAGAENRIPHAVMVPPPGGSGQPAKTEQNRAITL